MRRRSGLLLMLVLVLLVTLLAGDFSSQRGAVLFVQTCQRLPQVSSKVCRMS